MGMKSPFPSQILNDNHDNDNHDHLSFPDLFIVYRLSFFLLFKFRTPIIIVIFA